MSRGLTFSAGLRSFAWVCGASSPNLAQEKFKTFSRRVRVLPIRGRFGDAPFCVQGSGFPEPESASSSHYIPMGVSHRNGVSLRLIRYSDRGRHWRREPSHPSDQAKAAFWIFRYSCQNYRLHRRMTTALEELLVRTAHRVTFYLVKGRPVAQIDRPQDS